MKRDITLQELAAYLPWGLMMLKSIERVRLSGLHNDWSKGGVQVIYLSRYHEVLHKHGGRSASGFTEIYPLNYAGHCQFKPILRPLSDLTREITHDGETFVPIEELRDVDAELEWIDAIEDDWASASEKMKFAPMTLGNKLLEWHFDIFGLIHDWLAVDINTLGK